MRKKAVIIVAILLIVGIIYFIASGFREQKSVSLKDYTVSEDGSEIILKVELNSSAGHVRSFKDKGGAEKPHYLHFYSAFGGTNGSIGAKSEFTLELNEDDDAILFYNEGGGYTLVLEKNPQSGTWERAQKYKQE